MIFELIWGVAQLAALGFGGLYFYADYKRGFVSTKALVERAGTKFRQITGIRESETDKANRAVEKWARSVALLRESVASIKANHQLAEKRHNEETILAGQFRSIAENALRASDQDAATAAAMAKIQAEHRAQLFGEYAQEQMQVARILEQELEGVEVEYDIIRTQAETVKVNTEISEAKRNLYGLVSSIEAQTGFTARGLLEQAVINTEHEKLKTSAMLDMASKHSSSRVRRFMQLSEVNRELDETRRRIALLPAPAEAVEDIQEDGKLVEAEIVS